MELGAWIGVPGKRHISRWEDEDKTRDRSKPYVSMVFPGRFLTSVKLQQIDSTMVMICHVRTYRTQFVLSTALFEDRHRARAAPLALSFPAESTRRRKVSAQVGSWAVEADVRCCLCVCACRSYKYVACISIIYIKIAKYIYNIYIIHL